MAEDQRVFENYREIKDFYAFINETAERKNGGSYQILKPRYMGTRETREGWPHRVHTV
jgi:hypothetical protein